MSVATRAERRKKPSPDRSADARAVQPDGPQIDPEFASLIPALAPDELARLEASLLAEGCRDPLVVWEGQSVLLDGHNRHSLCTRHNIPYNIVSLPFASREAARDFILHTQLGRRNISPEAASYLRGKRYLEMKRQGERTDLTSGQNDPKRLSERLGEEYKVAEKTIRRDAAFAAAVDRIASNCGDAARAWLLSRDMTLARSGVLRIAKLSPREQRDFVAKLLDGAGKPRFPVARKTITLSRKPEELAPRLFDALGREEAAAVARLLARLLKGGTGEKKTGGRSRRRSRV
jgi:hypothetical protein